MTTTDPQPTPPAVRCAWCHGPHALPDCPHRPRLSLASVVAFVGEAMARGGRVWV